MTGPVRSRRTCRVTIAASLNDSFRLKVGLVVATTPLITGPPPLMVKPPDGATVFLVAAAGVPAGPALPARSVWSAVAVMPPSFSVVRLRPIVTVPDEMGRAHV